MFFVFGSLRAADFVKGRSWTRQANRQGYVGTDDDGFGVAVFVGGFHAVAQDLNSVVDVVADSPVRSITAENVRCSGPMWFSFFFPQGRKSG